MPFPSMNNNEDSLKRIERLENQISAIAFELNRVLLIINRVDRTSLLPEEKHVISQALNLLISIQKSRE